MLLLHGFPEFWFSWRSQLPALAKAGYPRGGPGPARVQHLRPAAAKVADYDIEKLSRDVAELIPALGADRARTWSGHDWGARGGVGVRHAAPASGCAGCPS